MDITVYLPDELGEQAKEADLPFSRLLRAAVQEELKRREAMNEALEFIQTYELDVLVNGYPDICTGRVKGTLVFENNLCAIYLTEDERVLLYDPGIPKVWDLSDQSLGDSAYDDSYPHPDYEPPEVFLRDNGWLGPQEYQELMEKLGMRPVVDL